MTRGPLAKRAQAILQDADRKILALAGGSRYSLYRLLHRTTSAFMRTDSFYVGMYRGDRSLVFPYNFDGHEYDDPNVNVGTAGGLTDWILTHRRSYWSVEDGGALLHRGRRFGDTTRRSEEGIVVPLLAPASRTNTEPVIGILSVLSYEAGVYDAETVAFLECLADSMTTLLLREREDEERRRKIGAAYLSDASTSSTEALERLGQPLGEIRRQAEALRTAIQAGQVDRASAAADTLCEACERAQTEVAEMSVATPLAFSDPLSALTAREREVALLIAAGRSNKEVAVALFISELTAKTHCSNIIRKLNAGGRSGVAYLVKQVGMSAPPSTSLE